METHLSFDTLFVLLRSVDLHIVLQKLIDFKAPCLTHILHFNLCNTAQSLFISEQNGKCAQWGQGTFTCKLDDSVTGLRAPGEDVVFTRPTSRGGTERPLLMQYLQRQNRNINFVCFFVPLDTMPQQMSCVSSQWKITSGRLLIDKITSSNCRNQEI